MGEIQRDPALISIPKVKRLNISLFTLFYFAFLPLYLLSHPSSPLSLPLRALIHLPPMLFQCSIFIKLQLGTLTKSRGCHSPPPRYDIIRSTRWISVQIGRDLRAKHQTDAPHFNIPKTACMWKLFSFRHLLYINIRPDDVSRSPKSRCDNNGARTNSAFTSSPEHKFAFRGGQSEQLAGQENPKMHKNCLLFWSLFA